MAYLKSNDWVRARTSLQQAVKAGRPFAGLDDGQKALASMQ